MGGPKNTFLSDAWAGQRTLVRVILGTSGTPKEYRKFEGTLELSAS